MSFLNLNIPIALNTSKYNLITDFFTPILKNSIKYDRGVGYFSSGWIKEAFEGMTSFAQNGGKARWITSPLLTKEDWDALFLGDEAKRNEILKNALAYAIKDLRYALHHETLIALAWMVADEILAFKLAKPRNKLDHEYHTKVGIFTDDEGNSISFDGSYNDSVTGLHNFESIKVFRSWDSTAEYVEQEIEWFERIWNNQDPNIEVFDIPEVIKANILEIRSGTNRPYLLPDISKLKALKQSSSKVEIPTPHLPSTILLRDYQNEAVEKWFDNDCKGIYEMATGTGKTLTALYSAIKLLKNKKQLLIVIVCPYIHLAKQWLIEAERCDFRPILVAESKQRWLEDAHTLLRDFAGKRITEGILITTNASFLSSDLRDLFEKYMTWHDTLLIADEMHHCGSLEMLKILPESIPYRLGLSATPVRSYDDIATDKLLNYFGGIVFSFGLKEAINYGFLTPYYYYPIPIAMMEDEFEEFIALSKKLNRLHPDPEQPISEAALRIAIKRARVLNNSKAKIEWLKDNINEKDIQPYTLFYVGDQVFDEIRKLIGYEKRIPIHEFTYRQNLAERSALLDQFERGEIKALIAMKCLDEGIDIPPTRTAYFLASSSITREFVQRRGRVLRNSPGKKYANLYDLISVPPLEYIVRGKEDPNYNVVRSALRREYFRIKEFASLAENKHQALNKFLEITNRFDLLSL